MSNYYFTNDRVIYGTREYLHSVVILLCAVERRVLPGPAFRYCTVLFVVQLIIHHTTN